MSAEYEAARRVALGLEREQAAQEGGDLWNISLGDGFSLQAEMPFQFFERGFEPPDEQTAQKAALMLFDEEFEDDRKAAQNRLVRMMTDLETGEAQDLSALIDEAPPEEWLSLIFLDGGELRDRLVPLLDRADENCRSAVSTALDKALDRLLEFRDLLEVLKKHC